jgi:DNA-binding XRE family transcriptional regulator
MKRRTLKPLSYQTVELEGVRYAVVRESFLQELCRRADVSVAPARAAAGLTAVELDRETLARRLTLRRKRAGLTQGELARRAGIRVETLNRVERGKTTPDFSTVRKLVVAINGAENQAQAELLSGVIAAKGVKRCQWR